MASAPETIESQITKLPLDELVSLHERLITAIHEKTEKEGLDPDYRQQIKRRIEEIDSGQVSGVDAFEAIKKM